MRWMRVPKESLYIIGFMGAGKTTVGHLLGEMCGLHVIDTDSQIEKQEKKLIRDIFTQYGEEYFRKLESEVLKDLPEMSIITTGGGIILNKQNRQFLKDTGRTVFLQCHPEVIAERLKFDTTRPLIKDKSIEEISEMYHQRLPLYKECAASND